jgi:hypothetical protein
MRLLISFICLIATLFASLAAGAADSADPIGKIYFLAGDMSLFYTSSTLLRSCKGGAQDFEVQEKTKLVAGGSKDYYIIRFNSGEIGYIDVPTFDTLVSQGQIKLQNKPRLDSDIQKELSLIDAEQSKKKHTSLQQQLTSYLKRNGIAVGKTVWLKGKKNEIPSLTKIKIKSINLLERDDYTVKYVRFDIIWAGKETSLTFEGETDGSFTAFFSTKDIIAAWGKRIVAAIRAEQVLLGMTHDQVAAAWGVPNDINRSGGRWGIHEQWVYDSAYLYFENGKLTSWQN